jgi:hypothetical protein
MLAYAASRTTMLYLLALTLLGGLWHWRMRGAESRRLMWAMLLSCIVIFAAQFALPLVNHLVSLFTHASVSNASGVERLAANGDDMGSRRIAEMGKAWLTFKSHPLWGWVGRNTRRKVCVCSPCRSLPVPVSTAVCLPIAII